MSQEFQQYSGAENSILKNSKLKPLLYYEAKINGKKIFKKFSLYKISCHIILIAQTYLISLKSYAPTYKPTHLEILGNEINPNVMDFKGVNSSFFKNWRKVLMFIFSLFI